MSSLEAPVPANRRVIWRALLALREIPSIPARAALSVRSAALETAVLTTAVIAFCAPFLDLGTRRALTGNEAEMIQALDWTLINSLARHGEFPLWNPYLQTGWPFVADPFLHAYNPLATLPVLLLGVMDGFKVALLLTFIAASLGGWWLGHVLGLSLPARLWVALSYAFTGQAVARFFQGEYDFVLGFAWIPWVIASLLAAIQTRRGVHATVAVLSMALLFFSGNHYYAFYMLFAIALLGIVGMVNIDLKRPAVRFDWAVAKLLLLIGALALGSIAIQLLPLVEFWPYMTKATTEMTGSHTPWQILLDYTSKDTWRPDAFSALPAREEYYAYIGVWPFLGLLLLPLALWKRQRMPLVFFALLLAFAVAWIDIREMPWRDLYARTYVLSQFRYPVRMLIFGALAVIVLSALGIDTLWKLLRAVARRMEASSTRSLRSYGAYAGLAVVVGFMVWSVGDVFETNRQHTRTRDPYEPSYTIMRWLREFDPGEFYVSSRVGWHGSIVSNDLRYIDAWYGFTVIPARADSPNQRLVRARPHYVVVGNDVPFNEPGAMKVQQFEGHSVYKMTEHLPFSFMVRNDTLNQGAAAGELLSQHVTALAPSTSSPNRVEVVADGEAGSTLVVLNRSYPGWEVTVDGRQQALRSPGGYLGTEVQQGTHRYQFTYNPGSFRVGLGLSLIALLATLGLAVRDVRPTWRAPTAGRRTLASFIRGVADLVDQPMPSRSTVAGRLPTVPRPTAGTPAGVPSILSGVLEARAVYQRGFLKPDGPLGLPERTRLLVTIDVDGRDGDAAETAGAPFVGPTGEGTARCAARMRSAEPRGEP